MPTHPVGRQDAGRSVVLIATPLQAELVDRIAAADPDIEVLFDPDLLPPVRYPNDHAGVPAFRRDTSGQQTFDQWIARCEVMFGVPGESAADYARVVPKATRLRWIQGTAAGEGQKVAEAGLRRKDLDRVIVTTASGVHARQLAEWAMFGILAMTKDLPRLLRDKEHRTWSHYPVQELRGQHLLIVGLGHLGREVARLGSALGMRVSGVRRTAEGPSPDGVEKTYATDDFTQALPTVDALVLALPDSAATRGMIDAEVIGGLPAHAIVVNIGRGSAVDQDALIEALQQGRIAGAALDVFATEPLECESPLWDMDNVLISPHTAALSTAENERIVELFIDNLARYKNGRPLRNQVDTSGWS